MSPQSRIRSLKVLVSALALVATSAASAETLRIGGTGVALGGMSILGEAFEARHPDVEVTVLPSLGSSGGVKAALANAIDIAVASRPLKDAEREKGAEERLYATTDLAVVTSIGTGVEAVSPDELEAIYAGEMTHWPDGTPIRLVLRPVEETDTKILRAMSEQMARAVDSALDRDGLLTATNDQENAETLESLDGSIGLVATGQIATEQRQLKVLRLVSSAKDPAPTADGQGRALTKSLYLVTTPLTKPIAAEFAAFVVSKEGREILAQHDHLPAE